MAGFQAQIDKLMEGEVVQARKYLEEQMNEAMNDRSAQAEARRKFGIRDWPPVPNREITAFHINNAHKALKKAERAFEDYKIGYKVETPKGKNPYAVVTVKPETRSAGGASWNVKKGDTLAKIAKDVYGAEEFAGAILEANPHLHDMPSSVKLPAGFPLRCPKLDIPKRHDGVADGLDVPRLAKEAAVEIPHPGYVLEVSNAKSSTRIVPMGPVLVTLTLTLEGKYSGTVEVKGTIDAKSDYKHQKVSMSKELNGLALNYEVDLKAKERQISVDVVNTKWRGIEFKTSLDLSKGSVKVQSAPIKVNQTAGPVTFDVSVTLTLEMSAKPNPRYKPPQSLGQEAVQEWNTFLLKSGAAKDALGDWVADNKGTVTGAVVVVGLVGALVLAPPPAKAAPAAALLGLLGAAA